MMVVMANDGNRLTPEHRMRREMHAIVARSTFSSMAQQGRSIPDPLTMDRSQEQTLAWSPVASGPQKKMARRAPRRRRCRHTSEPRREEELVVPAWIHHRRIPETDAGVLERCVLHAAEPALEIKCGEATAVIDDARHERIDLAQEDGPGPVELRVPCVRLDGRITIAKHVDVPGVEVIDRERAEDIYAPCRDIDSVRQRVQE